MAKIDATNEQVGRTVTKEIAGSGEARISADDSPIDVVQEVNFKDTKELDDFMNERVRVFLYEPMEEGHESVVPLSVNGINQFVVRGTEQTIKRKYVEVLARARRVSTSARGFIAPDGEARNIVKQSQGLQYPFQVTHDPSPAGPAWLRNILAEA